MDEERIQELLGKPIRTIDCVSACRHSKDNPEKYDEDLEVYILDVVDLDTDTQYGLIVFLKSYSELVIIARTDKDNKWVMEPGVEVLTEYDLNHLVGEGVIVPYTSCEYFKTLTIREKLYTSAEDGDTDIYIWVEYFYADGYEAPVDGVMSQHHPNGCKTVLQYDTLEDANRFIDSIRLSCSYRLQPGELSRPRYTPVVKLKHKVN
jgi:hypothetical protein